MNIFRTRGFSTVSLGSRVEETGIRKSMKSFDEKYPYIAAWVQDGTVEIGYNDYDDVFLRVIDAGGVVWESNKTYSNLDDAFSEMNVAIEAWCTENGIDLKLS